MCLLELEARLRALVKTCTRRQLSQLHGLLLTSSLHRLPDLPPLLVRRATDVGDMAYADQLNSSFLRDPPDAALYNAMIRGCAYHGPQERALLLFDEMPRRGLAPDSSTYRHVLAACARLRTWNRCGEGIHCRVLKEGLDHLPAIGSSLLAFYISAGGGGSLGDARKLFDGMRVKSMGLSNYMISEYRKAKDAGSAREVFDSMAEKDVVSWNLMLLAHVRSGDVPAAKKLFATMPTKNALSWTTMLRALSVVGDFVGMRRLFCRMPERDVVSWNWVLSSYTRHGRFSQALRFFPWMLLEGLVPNSFTVVSILSACQHLGKLRMGRWVHSNLVTPALQVHAAVGTALVEMYATCGDVASALVVFTKMGNKDVFSWNVMIRGLAVHGRADDALRLFDLMKRHGFRPDHYTFMGVLLACSQGGFVDEGLRAFDAMQKDHSILPSLEHYGCLIDLLCRGGNIEGAVSVMWLMPCRPDSEVWRVLLSGCRVQAGLGSAEESTASVIQSEVGDECGVEAVS